MKRTMRAALAVIAVALLIGVLPSPAAAGSEQDLIVQIAYSKIGDQFRLGANGPTKFDCSGFVWYVFNTAGLASRIGGKPVTARRFQAYFRERGLLSKDPKTARVGDLVFYGNPAKHSGIVTRIDNKGKPRITSALTIGVRETHYNTLDVRFNAFAHTGLDLEPPPSPTPSPSPGTSPDPAPTSEPTAAP
ncbi:MAG TPA: NlpC/P60 family protein [Candidatus Limnocylindrales bacterium]|jgi:hypothetical protein